MSDWPLKLLYDRQCPFCRREVTWLKERDRHGRLLVEDISDPVFDPAAYGLTHQQVMGALHGVLPDGRIVRRLEAVRAAYRVVGLGWLAAPTAWPLIGRVADRLYGLFARHRLSLGRLFGRQPACEHLCRR